VGGRGYIFVHEDMSVKKINITHKCTEKDLEICAVEIETEASKLTVLSLYRAHAGDFNRFTENFGDTLKYLYKPKPNFEYAET
jgi:hypothetical protein